MDQYVVEVVLFIVILFFGVWIVRLKRDSRENIPEEVPSLSPLEVRVIKEKSGMEADFISVQFRGVLPINSTTNLAFIISILTKDNNGKVEPVLSMIDTFQHPKSIVFQDLTKIGKVHENTGCEKWTTIGVVPTEILQPAFGGKQQLKITTMLIDADRPPKDFDDKGIALISCDYMHNFNIRGYQEEGDHVNKARVLSVQLGVAVAFSDGKFHQEESVILNHWINKMIGPYSKEKRMQLKIIYDNALKEACLLAENQDLNEEKICKELYEIGEDAQNYEALELAHEIMIANGEEDSKEMQMISKIAILLGINESELDYIRKYKVSKLDKPLIKV
jgi:tellurite resistance protein